MVCFVYVFILKAWYVLFILKAWYVLFILKAWYVLFICLFLRHGMFCHCYCNMKLHIINFCCKVCHQFMIYLTGDILYLHEIINSVLEMVVIMKM